MPTKRRPVNGEYSNKLKAIRSFVDFDYDLRKPLHSSQKRKINKYFEAIDALGPRSNKVYRSKNKKRLKRVQEFGRNNFDALPDIKVAFYESSEANPVKLRVTEQKVIAHGKYFDIRYVPFDRMALLQNPDKEVQRALDDPGAKGANWFRVAVGDGGMYSIASPRTRGRVLPFIGELMKKYDRLDESGKVKNNYWGNWLHGIMPMHARNQTDVNTFLAKDEKIRTEIKKKRKRVRRNAKNRRMRQ